MSTTSWLPIASIRSASSAGTKSSFVPFIVVREDLTARLARPVYYELAALAMTASGGKGPGVWSGGTFFPFPDGPKPNA